MEPNLTGPRQDGPGRARRGRTGPGQAGRQDSGPGRTTVEPCVSAGRRWRRQTGNRTPPSHPTPPPTSHRRSVYRRRRQPASLSPADAPRRPQNLGASYASKFEGTLTNSGQPTLGTNPCGFSPSLLHYRAALITGAFRGRFMDQREAEIAHAESCYAGVIPHRMFELCKSNLMAGD